MNESKGLTLQIAEGLATITLTRPDVGNALDVAACEEFARAAEAIVRAGRLVRAILLVASGKSFCFGGDVAGMARANSEGLAPRLLSMVAPLHRGLESLQQLDAPMVASVRGAAAGVGLSLVAQADIVVASTTAKFTMAYTGIGLSPDGGSTWWLPRIVGLRRSLELALTNRTLGAQEALTWGLVTRVVNDDVLDSEALATARLLAAGPTVAYGAIRRLIAGSLQTDHRTQLKLEEQAILHCGATTDAVEAVAAFANRRRAEFRGE
jgi:2-(1,2-epoxy-1,2-dihydrophenyl)acetyl-CoA isomerase